MKYASANVWFFLFFRSLSVEAWDVDPRCPPPPESKRDLQLKEIWFQEEDFQKNDVTSQTNMLRGPSFRDLQTSQNNVFSLKMYWEEGYCWQEEYSRERKWCWECVDGCKEGGILWWQKCVDVKDQKFTYLPDINGGRFKTAYHDLCLTSVSTTQYVLQPCSDNRAQVIVGFRDDGKPFELMPLGDDSQCINQDHHPKAGEIVENTTCKIARHWKTNLMELYEITNDFNPDIDSLLRIRVDKCSAGNPCDRCQGDCDKDRDCRGDGLVCFQRVGKTKDSPVPGCRGDTITDRDYCIDKALAIPSTSTPTSIRSPAPVKSFVPSPTDTVPLITKIRNCSPSSPCNRCEGDCDVDADCHVGLKCFQKDGAGEIPGCIGRDMTKNDFCF